MGTIKINCFASDFFPFRITRNCGHELAEIKMRIFMSRTLRVHQTTGRHQYDVMCQ